MTKRYRLEGNGASESDCTPALGPDKPAVFPINTNGTNLSRAVAKETTDEISFSWTTVLNEPNVADWPSGNYVASINVTATDAALSYKLQLLRTGWSCTVEQTLGTSGVLSGTGTKTYTINVDPTAGLAGDRYQLRVLASNTAMSAKTLSIGPGTASYEEGPWVPADLTALSQADFPQNALYVGPIKT